MASSKQTVESIIDKVAALDIKSKDDESSTTTAVQASEKKKLELLDMPPEILERIFKKLVDGQALHFVVGVGRSYGTGDVCERLIKEPRQWKPFWLPGLRLVSSKVKTVVTPIIAERAVLQIERGHMSESEKPLKLAPLYPAFVTSILKTVHIYD
jgi:hypothetical protein